MNRTRLAAVVMLTVSLLILIAMLTPTPASRPGPPARWFAQFWPLSSEFRRQVGEDPSPVAWNRIAGFTSEVPPRLIIHTECLESPQRRSHQEIWLADVDGTAPSRLVIESSIVISAVEPAPSGSRIAYVARPNTARTTAESWAAAQISLVDGVKSRVVVAAGGAIAPNWTADGRSIQFLRRVEGGWRPYQVDLANLATPPRAVADVIFALTADSATPAAWFSPDGQAVAGFREWELVVAHLEARNPPRVFPAIAGRTVDLSWSPDSAWLCLTVELGGESWPPTMGLALRVADGKQVDVASALGIIGKPAQDECIRIIAAAWMPGPGHRLLVLAYRGEPFSDDLAREPGIDPVHERRWLIYDLDAESTSEVTGLPTEEPNLTGMRQIHLSLDGRYLGIGQLLHRFDPSR